MGAILEPIGQVWLAALQMLVLPLTVAILLTAIGGSRGTTAGGTARATLVWFGILLAGAALLTLVVSPALLRLVEEGGRLGGTLAPPVPGDPTSLTPAPTLGEWLSHLVPANLIRAAANGDLFAVMVATILFGIALRTLPEEARAPIVSASSLAARWCLELAGLLFRVLPVAVFALTFTATLQSGAGMVAGLAGYVVLLSGLLVLATLALYPLTAWRGRVDMASFARAIWPTQVLAFSTRSSMACLPAMLTAATDRLALPHPSSHLVLPLSVASFKLNMGVSAIFQLLFLMHVYGIDSTPQALALAVLGVTLQSFSTPGLPSGAIWTTTPVYLAMGIPMEGIVLTNVVDTIPDLFKTVANVTGDLSIATIVGRHGSG